MILWRAGTVLGTRREWAGSVELDVEVDGRELRALAHPAMVGRPEHGDRVLLNVTALEKGLGTGGYALVVALPDRLPADPPPGPGHLVKARYTPGQVMVLGIDEQESPHHEDLREADDLGGLPVVVADLHSALPAVVAGVHARRPGARVVSLMTDGGALPAWFSRTTAGLAESGRIAGTVTVGQAFGGDVEAVTVHTGLLGARIVLEADVVVVAQGPGNLGTGTRWGFSGVAAGEALNAAATLGGRGIGVLRMSGTDPRERHRGLSHHSVTALGRVALAPSDVVVPTGLEWPDGDCDDVVEERLVHALAGRHRRVDVDVRAGRRGDQDGGPDLLAALREIEQAAGLRLSTMGRDLDADPVPFLAAAAAGVHAANLLPD
ncbi:DUF3866 family protein [Georgenia sp. Z1344]|uniref:DUF3866 family protein n=1 Tax=Georgenia sp. Z1344 TaxID=3416706 RepID=UPI003CE957CB